MLAARSRGIHPAAEGGEGVFEGRAAVGYDHGHDAEEVFYLGLALAEGYVEGFVEGCPERIGEDDPDEAGFLRGCGAAQGGEEGSHGRRVPLSRKKAFAAMGGGVGGTR
jgi:hypothetical protein